MKNDNEINRKQNQKTLEKIRRT